MSTPAFSLEFPTLSSGPSSPGSRPKMSEPLLTRPRTAGTTRLRRGGPRRRTGGRSPTGASSKNPYGGSFRSGASPARTRPRGKKRVVPKKRQQVYYDMKDQGRLREEIQELRKELRMQKRENSLLKAKATRTHHKMREKDANFQRLLQYQINQGRDPSGLLAALRNEKLLVTMLMERNSSLEQTARDKEIALQQANLALATMPRLQKSIEKWRFEAHQARRIMGANAEGAAAKYEEEIQHMSRSFEVLHDEYDLVSAQHLTALKIIDSLKCQLDDRMAWEEAQAPDVGDAQ